MTVQPKPNPLAIHPKVAAGAIVGGNVALIIYVAGLFGAAIPPEVAVAIVADLSFLAGWLTKA
jgi:hypothetical protein